MAGAPRHWPRGEMVHAAHCRLMVVWVPVAVEVRVRSTLTEAVQAGTASQSYSSSSQDTRTIYNNVVFLKQKDKASYVLHAASRTEMEAAHATCHGASTRRTDDTQAVDACPVQDVAMMPNTANVASQPLELVDLVRLVRLLHRASGGA